MEVDQNEIYLNGPVARIKFTTVAEAAKGLIGMGVAAGFLPGEVVSS